MKLKPCSHWLRLTALCLICVALLGIFAGCGKKPASETTGSAQEPTAQVSDVPADTVHNSGDDPAPDTEAAPAESQQPVEADTTAPSEVETLPAPETDSSIDYEGLGTKDVYTVDALPADDARLDTVIAECGDRSMTNRELQLMYYMQFRYYYNQIQQAVYYYGMPADYFKLDVSRPLSEQDCQEVGGLTWEEFFLMIALDDFASTAAMEAEAKAAGFTLSEEDAEALQETKDNLAQQAEQYGFANVDEMLQDTFGSTVTQEGYERFMDFYTYVDAYEEALYDDITWNDDDLLEYFRNNSDRYQGIPELPNVNVRHILITPEDADGDKVSTDEEKAAAKAKAEELLNQFLSDPSEQNFASLASEESEDPGSKEKGGLYEDVYPGQMVASFNDWCFDASRQPGDTGIVETDYGYHIMYFVSQADTYYWKTVCERDYPNYRLQILIDEAKEKTPLSVDYASIVIAPMPDSVQQSAG